MHRMLYVVLLAASSLAHFHVYDTRNLIERDEPEPENQIDGLEIVECPVCEDAGLWIPSNEECPIVRRGKAFKKCKYGAYNNPQCGNRRDCFKGPGEVCTEKLTNDYYGWRCAPGHYCNPAEGKCTGMSYTPDINKIQFFNHNQWYHDRPSALNPNSPIRSRRQAN